MNVLIVIISILVTILSIKLFKKASGSMSLLKFNTVSYVFYVQIVTSALVASVVLVTGMVDYHPDVQIISESTRFEAWLWVMYSIISMPIGMIALNRFLKTNGIKAFNDYLNKPFTFYGTEQRNNLLMILTAIFSVSVLAYVFYYTERIALYTLLVEHDPAQAAIDRVTSRRHFQGIEYIKNLMGYIMIPVMTFYSYILFREKKKLGYLGIFLVNFICAILMFTHDTQKAPVAFLFLGFWIIEVVLRKGVKLKTIVLFVGIPVLLILIGYQFTTNKDITDQLLRFNSAFYGRFFLASYFAFPLSLELFPNIITDHTYAVGIPERIIKSYNINFTESARLVKMYVHPERIADGTGNLYSGYYLAEAWANYGYIGLLIAPYIVGIIVQSVHLFLLKSIKTPLTLAFYTAITIKWVVNSGFVNFLFLKLLIWPLILFLITRFFFIKILK